MSLILKILSFNGQPSTDGEEVVINEQGGSIGRSDANSLMLPDEKKMISRRHATLTFEDGHYLLNDTSLAGTFVDAAVEPINNASVQLLDGMQLNIGDYTIACSIDNDEIHSGQENPFLDTNNDDQSNDPFSDDVFGVQDDANSLLDGTGNDSPNPFLEGDSGHDFSNELLGSVETNTETDFFADIKTNSLLEQGASDEFNTATPFADNGLLNPENEVSKQSEQGLLAENQSSLNDSFIPSEPVKQEPAVEQGMIPEDFDFEDFFNMDEGAPEAPPITQQTINEQAFEPIAMDVSNDVLLTSDSNHNQIIPESITVEPVQQVNPPTIQKSEIDNSHLLNAFLQGAQIENNDIDLSNPDEKMTRIGTMFRQFVESTVSVLRSRAEFKSLFRVTVTTIQRAGNNPLKFSVTTDEALKHLINDGQGGFKKSVESIDEGFNDLLNHQLAMQAGIQASLQETLKQFDPALIEKQYEEGIVLQKKSKCWEKYIKVHKQLSETAVDDFFGDAFSEAYEKQMQQLKK